MHSFARRYSFKAIMGAQYYKTNTTNLIHLH